MQKIYIGANYYPEDWDEKNISWDIKKMKENGFNVVRIGEFAWAKDEPVEGKFDFSWLHQVIDRLGEAGIKVIMGTPTATPPHWLYKKFPDMATVNANGIRTSHGGRRHCCSSNPDYNRYSAIIVEKLAMEFGNDKNIIGWQIDNEIYPSAPGCCCEHCLKNFHKRLKEKYGSVENINAAWNLNLFSQKYDSIDDIPAPVNAWHNPHIKLEWNLSQAENHVDFVHMQADIIRKYSKAPVGTDTVPGNQIDYRKLDGHLDVAQYNHYNTYDNISDPAMWMDYLRKFSRLPLWNTETDPCWNGATSQYFPMQRENFKYFSTWLPMICGGQAILFWLWRTHWAGHELMHGAIYDSCGRETHANGEIRRAVKDIAACEDFLSETSVVSDTAIHMSSLNWNIQLSQDIILNLEHGITNLSQFYSTMNRSGIHPDVIDLREKLDGYKLIVTPLAYTLEEGDFRERISAWVRNGGVWIAGPLTDIRTAIGTKYKDAPYGFLEELTGAYLKYTLPRMEENVEFEIRNENGDTVKCERSFELFDDEGEKLLTVTKGHSAIVGKSCASIYNVGKGKVILLGTFPEKKELARIIKLGASLAHSDVHDTDGAFITLRKGKDISGVIAASMDGEKHIYRFDGKKRDIVTSTVHDGSIALAPYQVAVLEDI